MTTPKCLALSAIALAASSFTAHADWSNTADAPTVVTADAETPHMASTADGHTYVSYVVGGTGSVYVALYDAYGNKVWNSDLLALARNQSYWYDYGITTDTEGNAYLACGTGGGTGMAVVKITPDGSIAWSQQIEDADSELTGMQVMIQSVGDKLVTSWAEANTSTGLLQSRLARLDSDGDVIWNDVIGKSDRQVFLAQYATYDDSVTAVMEMKPDGVTSNYAYQYFVQKWSMDDGTPQWGDDYEALTTSDEYAHGYTLYRDIRAIGDTAGGLLVSWFQPNTGTPDTVTVQHVLADGTFAYAGEGTLISPTSDYVNDTRPMLAWDGSNAYVSWVASQDASQPYYVLYGASLDASGNSRWGSAPTPLNTPTQLNEDNFLNYISEGLVWGKGELRAFYGSTDTSNVTTLSSVGINPDDGSTGTPTTLNSPTQTGQVDAIRSPYGEARLTWVAAAAEGALNIASVLPDGTLGAPATTLLEQPLPTPLSPGESTTIALHYLDRYDGTHTLTATASAVDASVGDQASGYFPVTLSAADGFAGGSVDFSLDAGADSATLPLIAPLQSEDLAIAKMGTVDGDEGSSIMVAADVSGSGALTYTWTQTSGPDMSFTSDGATLSIAAPYVAADTSAQFKLKVSDGSNTVSRKVTVNVLNVVSPVIEKHADYSVESGGALTIEPSITGAQAPLTYKWTQTSGPDVFFFATPAGDLRVRAISSDGATPSGTVLVFKLKITDANDETATRKFTVNVE